MNDDLAIRKEKIITKILFIRNNKVMIDSDLAELYGVSTSRLNEQVKRNNNRFPTNFMFSLTLEEKKRGYRKLRPPRKTKIFA
ncbi:MAG: ORF6N domain-containing protein [Flavobacteriaceae bacterium]